ncbi:MAG TPA: copper amine oxidase N-terminal domain-containing protein, partial [Candidatus Cryosericum sp.]
SKYLRVRVWDKSGRLFLDQPLDPQGTLPTGEWSTITVPFGMYGSQDVSAIALTLVTGQDKIACDQRLTINVDNIVPLTSQNIMILQVGKATFTMNGTSKTLDSSPVIKNGRTLVPIRAIIEALGGTVDWDATTKKATVTLGKKTIALWIGKSAATVNGVSTLIDSTNAKVVPEIINSRTMLPLRFVTENLGCSVVWAATTKTITITYQ